ncbi:MAG TPA: hypothetical protein VLE02_00990 [Nitrosarchaeum sp.]|nr:hypothetical protein [Nitrosarchaeum sp.]
MDPGNLEEVNAAIFAFAFSKLYANYPIFENQTIESFGVIPCIRDESSHADFGAMLCKMKYATDNPQR